MTTLIVTLPTEDAERPLAILDTYLRHLGRPAAPLVEASAEATLEPATWVQRRADLLVDLLEEDVANLHATSNVDTNRFTVNVDLD